jgi:hypothetical protein
VRSSVSRRSARSKDSRTLPDGQLRLSPRQRLAVSIAGLLLVLQAGGIFAQLVVLSDSNDRIHAQDAKIGDLRRDAEPLLAALRPLVRETRPLVREARAVGDPLRRSLDDVSAAAEAAPPALRAARVLVGRSLPLVESLQLALPELRALLPRAAAFLDEAARRALLRRADEAVSAALHLESLQSTALRLQRRQFAVQRETLAIQREALGHIRSLDRKTGGQLPAGGG